MNNEIKGHGKERWITPEVTPKYRARSINPSPTKTISLNLSHGKT